MWLASAARSPGMGATAVQALRALQKRMARSRRERPQNGAGSFQDGMPAVRLEHDARVEIAPVVDECRAVAAKSRAGASWYSSVRRVVGQTVKISLIFKLRI